MDTNETKSTNFIHKIIDEDIENGLSARIHTRFPPEPNGYLHIGHAKALCLDFGVADEFGGLCNLRMGDTNPTKENYEYVNSIIEAKKHPETLRTYTSWEDLLNDED